MSRVGSKKFGGLIDEFLVFQTDARIVFQKNKLKVKLPALPRGASVAKPSGTPPKPPVFALRATPRSPVAILSGRSLWRRPILPVLPHGASRRRRVKPGRRGFSRHAILSPF